MKNSAFTRRQSLQWAAALATGSSLQSFAQSEWPKDKAITFVVPFTAGSW
jgi:tripartite-type tricarboxylate transporter receptor subunit TctC